jgi:hypothetical protein
MFNSATDAIELLKKAQAQAEELYVSAPDPEIRLLDTSNQEDGENE